MTSDMAMDQSRELLLGETVLALTDTLIRGFDTVSLLRTLVERSTALTEASAASAVVVDTGERILSEAASDEDTLAMETGPAGWQEGCPLRECYRSAKPLPQIPLAHPYARARWPRYASAARARGFTSVSAHPLRHRGSALGVLSLLSTQPRRSSAQDVRVAQVLADAAGAGLGHHYVVREKAALTRQLQTALHTRVVIEQAKGILAERRQLPLDDAFTLLRQHSRSRQRRLADVAHEVITGIASLPLSKSDAQPARPLTTGP